MSGKRHLYSVQLTPIYEITQTTKRDDFMQLL